MKTKFTTIMDEAISLIEEEAKKQNIDLQSLKENTFKCRFERIPIKYQNMVLKGLKGRLSASQRLKLVCYECCGFRDLKPMISECSDILCPVWKRRPYKKVLVEVE